MKEEEQFRFEVAGLVFSILSAQDRSNIQFDEIYRGFLSTGQPAIPIYARYGDLPRFSLGGRDRIFDSEADWRLYHVEGRYAIVLGESDADTLPDCIVLFDDEVSQVEVYSEPMRLPGGLLADPLQRSPAQVLMVHLLARGRGLMMHACGIDDSGRGYLFAGNSTHGKTTMARLWKDQATILNDDRIVLRWREGRFWMYGTPWHGEYAGISAGGVPLEKVFFLRHAGDNQARRVEGVTASLMLLTRCFPPFWDADGMSFTLDFVAQLVEAVPCYELGFLPDRSAVDYVRCVS
jgi:hypothetical protein